MDIPLFYKDYAYLSNDHIDYSTSNLSFLRMYRILKTMGVKNNKFFLLLYDTSLRGIDPHNLPNDDLDLKLRIARECKVNPWYMFRCVIRVPASGTEGIPFKLNRANLSLIWLYMNHLDNLLVIPRQTGKTVSSIALVVCILYIIGQNINFSMLTKDAKLRKENVERLQEIRDLLPQWLLDRRRTDTESREEVSYGVLSNKYQTYVAQMSITGAEKLGRGMTTPSQHWDEIAYFSNIETTYNIALSSTNAAIESAKAVGQPYGNILTTTAGKLNTTEGVFTHGLMTSSLLFDERLYDSTDQDELTDVVRANSPRGMVYSEFSYAQLGKTEQWFKEKSSRMTSDDAIKRDLLNIWTFGSQLSPIDQDVLERLHASRTEPLYVQKIDEYLVRWYLPKEVILSSEFSKIPIVIAMDASSNVGRDFTSFVFVDARTMLPIGTCSCNSSNIIKVALFICRWLKLPNIGFVPESNHVGRAIIDYCILELDKLGINPFKKIFNGVIQDLATWTKEKKITLHDLTRPGAANTYRKEFGFSTSSQSRPFLYKVVFDKAMEVGAHNIKDITLINQISGLTIRNGRIDHAVGGNDDSVVAYLLACNWLLFGNNLDLYTFSEGHLDNILSDIKVVSDGEEKTAVDPVVYEDLKDKITVLERRIRGIDNPANKINSIHKLNALKKQLPPENENILADIQSLSQLRAKKSAVLPMNEFSITNYLQGLGG